MRLSDNACRMLVNLVRMIADEDETPKSEPEAAKPEAKPEPGKQGKTPKQGKTAKEINAERAALAKAAKSGKPGAPIARTKVRATGNRAGELPIGWKSERTLTPRSGPLAGKTIKVSIKRAKDGLFDLSSDNAKWEKVSPVTGEKIGDPTTERYRSPGTAMERVFRGLGLKTKISAFDAWPGAREACSGKK